MVTSYEQFQACLRSAAARRLIGVEMSDAEAVALAADATASRAYFGIWSARATQSSPVTAVTERTLLDITTVGRGGEPARVRVTTGRLALSTTGGVSAWKTLLGLATLGVSTVATGIHGGTSGDLDVPVGSVTAAMITKTGLAYSTVTVKVAGSALEFGFATVATAAIVGSINAAVAGGMRADAAAQAWELHTRGQTGRVPTEHQLRKQIKTHQISEQQFQHGVNVAQALRSLAAV